jgi:hypothetical protein
MYCAAQIKGGIKFVNCQSIFIITKTYWKSGILYIVFKAAKDATIAKNQSGMILNGKTITMDYFNPQSMNQPKGSIVDLLTTLVTSRYNSQTKFLNLENIIEDPNFKSAGIPTGFSTDAIGSRFGAALCRLIEDLCPNVIRF